MCHVLENGMDTKFTGAAFEDIKTHGLAPTELPSGGGQLQCNGFNLVTCQLLH